MPRMEMTVIPASEVKPGMLLDLEGDAFADPYRDNTALACEFARVWEVERETAECVCIYGDNFACGFPAGHGIRCHGTVDDEELG